MSHHPVAPSKRGANLFAARGSHALLSNSDRGYFRKQLRAVGADNLRMPWNFDQHIVSVERVQPAAARRPGLDNMSYVTYLAGAQT